LANYYDTQTTVNTVSGGHATAAAPLSGRRQRQQQQQRL